MSHGPSQPIESPDEQNIAALKLIEAGIESRPLVFRPGRFVSVNKFFRYATPD